MSQLRVRSITALDKGLITFVEKLRAQLNLRPCLNEVETQLEMDPTGMFVGELDGKPIGCFGALKYDDTFCVASDGATEKKYRGKGYGREIRIAAAKSTFPSHNIAVYAGDHMVKSYVKWYNFQPLWSASVIDLHISTAFQVLSQIPLSSVYSVKTIGEVDQGALYDYDTEVFGYPRELFLQKFLRLPGSHARVAMDGNDNIVGYTAARVAVNNNEGYRLGPLYAESSAIAKVLLRALFQEMLEKGWSSSPSVWLHSPVGRNAEAKTLMEFLDGKLVMNRTYMTTKGVPKGRHDSWFAAASGNFG